MAIKDILGDLVPPTRLQELRLRKVNQAPLQDEHGAGILARVHASEAAVESADRLGLPHVQGQYTSGVGGRGE